MEMYRHAKYEKNHNQLKIHEFMNGKESRQKLKNIMTPH